MTKSFKLVDRLKLYLNTFMYKYIKLQLFPTK